MNSLMAEVLEGHIVGHAFSEGGIGSEGAHVRVEVLELIRIDLKW